MRPVYHNLLKWVGNCWIWYIIPHDIHNVYSYCEVRVYIKIWQLHNTGLHNDLKQFSVCCKWPVMGSYNFSLLLEATNCWTKSPFDTMTLMWRQRNAKIHFDDKFNLRPWRGNFIVSWIKILNFSAKWISMQNFEHFVQVPVCYMTFSLKS